MQNKKTFLEQLRGKGYYIAIALCALAVGISGYLFCRDLAKREDGLSLTPHVGLAVLPTREPTEAPVIDIPESPAIPAGKEELPPVTEAVPTVPAKPDPEPTRAAADQPTARTVWPLEGEVIQTFAMDHLAYNETTRDWRTHAGLDLMAQEGTQVVCARDGVVESVFQDDCLGQTVTVSHDGGYVTWYCNLAPETTVTAGQAVSAGQVLGTVGVTALMEVGQPPHLHFAVYRDRVPQDPEAFLGK